MYIIPEIENPRSSLSGGEPRGVVCPWRFKEVGDRSATDFPMMSGVRVYSMLLTIPSSTYTLHGEKRAGYL